MRGLMFSSVRLCARSFPSYRHTLSVTPYNRYRLFHSSHARMSDLMLSLTAPNGRQYTQPTGLFINNEFVASKDGDKFATINPA